jgi:hypothetical protein
MQGYEFSAIISGGTIRIPPQYADRRLSAVRVIVVPEDAETQENPVRFAAMRLHTKNFKFNREDANER